MLHALVFVLQILRPDIGELLEFDRARIFSGEVWRVFTFLFASSGFMDTGPVSILFFFFMVMIAFMMNEALEGAWGVFQTSIFHYCGILGLLIGNFVFPDVMPGSGYLIYGTSFLAFATLFPRVEFMLFFILPVQVRFLAMLQGALMLLAVPGNWLLLPFYFLGCANYLIFAGIPALRGTMRVLESSQRRKHFNASKMPQEESFHTCAYCGRTDVTNPELEFRVGKDGNEHCNEHMDKAGDPG
jgi:hypothetical protein